MIRALILTTLLLAATPALADEPFAILFEGGVQSAPIKKGDIWAYDASRGEQVKALRVPLPLIKSEHKFTRIAALEDGTALPGLAAESKWQDAPPAGSGVDGFFIIPLPVRADATADMAFTPEDIAAAAKKIDKTADCATVDTAPCRTVRSSDVFRFTYNEKDGPAVMTVTINYR